LMNCSNTSGHVTGRLADAASGTEFQPQCVRTQERAYRRVGQHRH
jgi:hypothetical protein